MSRYDNRLGACLCGGCDSCLKAQGHYPCETHRIVAHDCDECGGPCGECRCAGCHGCSETCGCEEQQLLRSMGAECAEVVA